MRPKVNQNNLILHAHIKAMQRTMNPYHFLLLFFFEYFDFMQTRESTANIARVARRRHQRVNRSIIGQQAALSSSSVPALLTTVAPQGRESGTGEIAGEVTVSEMSVSGDNSSATTASIPSRRQERTEARRGSPRRRHYNVDFGISNSASLPPSTSNIRNLNVDGMEARFSGIAQSIQELTKHAMCRSPNVVNDDLIKALVELDNLERLNENPRLIAAYRIKISDLEKEKMYSDSVRDEYFKVKNVNGSVGESSTVELTEEGGGDSSMSVISDDDLHKEVRRRERLAARGTPN